MLKLNKIDTSKKNVTINYTSGEILGDNDDDDEKKSFAFLSLKPVLSLSHHQTVIISIAIKFERKTNESKI